MTALLDPSTVDLSLLQDRQVAVLGYDAVASAHALNLRDSGVDVRVGAEPDGRAAARAQIDGLMVMPPEHAVAACDIVLVPAAGPEAAGRGRVIAGLDLSAVQGLVSAHTEPGDLVIVTSASLRLDVPTGVDLAMIQALGDGPRLREEYVDGRGCPALVAVEHDSSGAAWATLTAYAAAMGSLRSGAIVTTMAHEALAGRFAEQAVHGLTQHVVETAFTTLVEAGVEPEVAYLATLQALRDRLDQVCAAGFASQHGPDGRGRHQEAAESLAPGLPQRMADLLGRVVGPAEGPPATTPQAGRETEPGAHGIPASRQDAARSVHPIEQVGARVRSLMSWVR